MEMHVARFIHCFIDVLLIYLRCLAAMVTALDAGVGEVLTALQRRSIINNTLVVFMSDVSDTFVVENISHALLVCACAVLSS